MLPGVGELDVFGAAVPCASVAAAAATAAAVAAASGGSSDPTVGVDDTVALAVASPEFAVASAPLLFEASGWMVVVALASAAAFAFAAAMALAVVCSMPCAATTVAIALPLVLALIAALLLAAELPSAGGLELAGFCALEVWLDPVSVGAGALVAGGLGADGLAGVDGLGGADVVASSKAANGCEAVSWLNEDACIRDGDVSETAAGKSGPILDILDT